MGRQHVCGAEYSRIPVSRRRTPSLSSIGPYPGNLLSQSGARRCDSPTWCDGTMLTLIVEVEDPIPPRRRRPKRPPGGIAMPQLPLHLPTWLTLTMTNEAKREYRPTSLRGNSLPSLAAVSWIGLAGHFPSACKRKMPHHRQRTTRFPTFPLSPPCNDRTKRGGREP